MKNRYLKVVIVFVFIFLVTGCDATYNIKIADGEIEENFTFKDSNSKNWEVDYFYGETYADKVLNYNTSYIPAFYSYIVGPDEGAVDLTKIKKDGIPYYNKELIAIGNKESLGMKFNYTFTYEEYEESTVANEGVGSFRTEITNNNVLTITSGDSIKSLSSNKILDKLVVNVTTDYVVVSTNADYAKYNKYTWIINKEDFEDHEPLQIAVNLNEKILTVEDITSNILTFSIIAIVIVLVIITFIKVKKTVKNNNEM